MITAIVGSRNYNDYNNFKQQLKLLKAIPTVIVSGGAKTGADFFAKKYAIENDIKYKEFPALWEKYGKRAGMLRNKDIITDAEQVIAFWDKQSKGTANSIEIANNLNKPLIVYYYLEGDYDEYNIA